MRHYYLKRSAKVMSACIGILLLTAQAGVSSAQGTGVVVINMGPLDGVPLSPDNVFSYALQSGLPAATEAVVKGSLRYRQSNLAFSYTFHTTLRPGLNRLEGGAIHPEWTFSDGALRELFLDYRMLPEGTYEYCVTVSPLGTNREVIIGGEATECLYGKSEDVFLINLMEPENKAKLYEHYPVFSWIVNYPFASQLTYRIRVAEMKEGQNAENAVVRNNAVYTESSLPQTMSTYPVYGTPLKTFQPYGWTVDAYYKGILLGGAEPWQFTIVEDSELAGIPRVSSYLDIKKEQGTSTIYAIGKLKLKYVLDDFKKDSLSLKLSLDNEAVKLDKSYLAASLGDNRYEIDFYTTAHLKHLKTYSLEITSANGGKYTVQFKYVNPDFL